MNKSPAKFRRLNYRLSLLASLLILLLMGTSPQQDPPAADQNPTDQSTTSSSPPPVSPAPSPSAQAAKAASPRSVPSYRQAQQVAVLTIHGGIDSLTLRSLERRITKARKEGADAIVLDINTPGGELLATLDICNLLKDSNITPANTVSWIHPQAYSAGTIISLACREIVVSPNSTFGDAAPVSPLMPLPLTERAKLESPILQEVVDSARRNHYDEKLVQAFISVGVELWLLEHNQNGERIFVDRNEYKTIYGEEPPDQLTPVAPPSLKSSQPQVRPWINELFQLPINDEDGELPTAEERAEEIEFGQLLPPVRQPLSESDRDQWTLITQIVTNDRLLTIKPAEAIHFGLAHEVIANDEELKAFFGASILIRYDQSWSETMVRFLISLPVRAVLIVIFLIALFIELAVPGVGVFGMTALIALMLLIGAPYLAGMAQWWDILLILLGILLVMVELFLIPGIGIAGFAGAACLLAGMVGTFISGDLSSPDGLDQMFKGLITIFTSLFAAGAGIWILSRQFHSIPILNRVVLHTNLGETGPGFARNTGMLGAMGATSQQALEPGDTGTAETDLRPSGKARFKDRIINVKSASEFIEKGVSIRVVSVGRFVIEVEESQA